MKNLILLLTVLTFLFSCKKQPERRVRHMYLRRHFRGVIAAYSAKMLDKKVLLIEPQKPPRRTDFWWCGLGFTDIGNKQVVTGLSKKIFTAVWELITANWNNGYSNPK